MTYIPPFNGGRINATLAGNSTSAGAGYALISTGTMTLAGGNNITLSQNGNAITFVGAAVAAGSNTFGMSNLGNTSGTTGVVNGSGLQMLLAGGNNITLSQSTNASSATITISAANQTNQTFGMYAVGNTTGQSSSTTRDARSVSFSGLGAASVGFSNSVMQFSVPTQTNQTFGMYALGNTTGQSSSTTRDARSISFSGLGAASVGFSNSVMQFSVPTQTVQTQNLHNLTLAGNSTSAGAGYIQISSGTLTLAGGNNITLSQNGNAVTISAPNLGGGGGIALANSQTTYTSGTANMVVAGGAMTIASTTGQSYNFSVPQTSSLSATGIVSISTNASTISIGAPAFSAGMSNIGNTSGTSGTVSNQLVFAGGNNITLSQSTGAGGNTISISGGTGASPVGSYFDNMFQQAAAAGAALTYTSVSTAMFGRVIIQPLSPSNELFPFNITASTMLLNFSNSGSSNISGAHSSSWYVGIYTRANSTQLSLLNSVSTSYTMNANVGNSASYLGNRWLSFHSSLWSASPAFSGGARYFFAFLARTAGGSYASHSMAGMHLGNSVQRSGFMATGSTGNTSFNAWHPFMGVHSLTTHVALPASIANTDINKASSYANFIPQVIFDAGLGQMA